MEVFIIQVTPSVSWQKERSNLFMNFRNLKSARENTKR